MMNPHRAWNRSDHNIRDPVLQPAPPGNDIVKPARETRKTRTQTRKPRVHDPLTIMRAGALLFSWTCKESRSGIRKEFRPDPLNSKLDSSGFSYPD